ncbi:hypothetical protein Asppvi_009060 [Aspergillus pseudoviridinutans]|uniref:DUF7703 domain-containing protein n=1 Tax=Aspergillus pseudoviridinutans TaxID=1517512 RepID=A0A9P3BFE8_9EURO|nr:uncharacterized protein Asppvi_009060 [Aspergillus pseudoviridinutans]GIJ90110.1 hypothetical protein Asppvi_009060 [Aspergillus pseudoviridinutans]
MSSIRSTNTSLAEDFAIACLIAISWYNAIELIVLCFTTFKKYGGFYFWALLVSSIGIIPFGLGYILLIFNIYPGYFAVSLADVGWCAMVTGQSLVLWSRLHLVVYSRKVLRASLAMIIIDGIILHTIGWVFEMGAQSPRTGWFTPAFEIFERVQLIGFSIQEIILSIIYTKAALRLLRLRPRRQYRSTLVQLVIINVLFILMDAAIVSFQYAGLFHIHVSFKAMVYSVKLKLEYAILGKLVHMSLMSHSNSAPTDPSDAMEMSRRTNNRSHLETTREHRESQASIIRDGAGFVDGEDLDFSRTGSTKGSFPSTVKEPEPACVEVAHRV